MILHSITVENWRNFLGECFVGPFNEGLNILHAPNATGKSTLFEALQRALMDNHNTAGEEVRRLRPWGRNLSPRVTVEFTVGGVKYRVTKKFLDGPKSLMERFEEGRFTPLAEGPGADEGARKLFTASGPKKGLSRPEHWGLRQILWAPQGRVEMGELSGDLLDDIRKTAAEQVVDDRARAVENALKNRYDAIFTPTGRVKKTSNLKRLEEEIGAAAERLEAVKRELGEADFLATQVQALARKNGVLGGEVRRLEEEKDGLEKRAAAYEKLKSKLDKVSSGARAAEVEFREKKRISDQIEEAELKKNKLMQSLEELGAKLPKIEAAKGELGAALAAAEEAFEAARGAERQADAALSRARDAARAADLSYRMAELAAKLKAVEMGRKTLAALEEERNAGKYPSNSEIKALREAFARLEEARIRLEASRVALEIIPDGAFTGQIEADGETTPLSLTPGKAFSIEGAPEVKAHIESFGVIRAYSPLESAKEAAAGVRQAEEAVEKAAAPFGTGEKNALEELYEKGLSLDGRLQKERAALNALLGGESEDTLSHRAEAAEAELKEIWTRFPEWKALLPDAAELEAAGRAEKKAAAQKALEAEKIRDDIRKAWSEKDAELKVAGERLKGEEKGLESLEEGLRNLQDDGLTKKERAETLTKAAIHWEAARALGEECGREVEEFGPDPTRELEKASGVLEQKAAELKEAENSLISETARLETYSGRGLYSRVALLEEKLSQLEADYRREKLAVDSTRLLCEAFSKCRSEMAQAVNRAASARSTEIFCRIAGECGGRLILADSMKPSGYVPGGMDENADVGIDGLSGGEKEQLHFAVRMALAEWAATEERELLVLDDILMATDEIRFHRILQIIEEASKNLQVLILTCRPERFAPVKKANRIDLAALAAK
jgi:chromosome segregation ATPase